MIDSIFEAALTEGEKAVANFGIKLATVMLGSIGSILILREVHQFDDPVTPQQLQTSEGLKKVAGRASRDACITAGCSITASVVYAVAADAIINS